MSPSRCHLLRERGSGRVEVERAWPVSLFRVLGREYFEIFSSSLQVKVLAEYAVALECCFCKAGPSCLACFFLLCVCAFLCAYGGQRTRLTGVLQGQGLSAAWKVTSRLS